MLLSLAVTIPVQAKMSDLLPEPKLKDQLTELNKYYAGFGITQKLAHLNAEWVNSYGIAYAKLGVFMNADNDMGAQVGFRYPYHLTGTNQNGYYVGVYAGHLDNLTVDDEDYQRLGVGVDLAYVMLDKERISTISVGMGAVEKIEGQNGTVKDVEPELQFSYSLSFDFF